MINSLKLKHLVQCGRHKITYLHLSMIYSAQLMIDTQNVHFSRSSPLYLNPLDSFHLLLFQERYHKVWLNGSDWDELLPRHLNDEIAE